MADLRETLISTAREMNACGLSKGTSGNVSVRWQDGYYITPTGMDYATLTPEDIPWLGLDGRVEGKRKPSSEWRFHHDLYAQRPEAQAIVHAHSSFAVSLACLRLEIPPFHYMIARFGGATVRCADYATFGTQTLSDHVLLAMTDRSACLMANHGMLVFGKNPKNALDLGVELESLCEQYWRACQLGTPSLLSAEEMAVVLEKFIAYGQQPEPQPE